MAKPDELDILRSRIKEVRQKKSKLYDKNDQVDEGMNKWTKINSVKDGYLGKTEKVNERKMSRNEQMIERKNDLENPGMKE